MTIPEFRTVLRRLLLDRLFGVQRFNFQPKAFFQPGLEFQRFGKQEPGVDRENRKPKAIFVSLMDDHEAGTLKARPDGRAFAVGLPSPAQNLHQIGGFKILRLPVNQLRIEFFQRHKLSATRSEASESGSGDFSNRCPKSPTRRHYSNDRTASTT